MLMPLVTNRSFRYTLEYTKFNILQIKQTLPLNCVIRTMELLIAEGTQLLPWATRIKVAIGAALGLTFLHDDSNQQIIYRDFKASNILLDLVC